MAERRMFAKSVINSARFLRMPPSSRLLYYDLGMAADDDGIVEAYTVIRTTGAAEDDLRVLAAKGFIIILNEDLVAYITDWKRNNLIKKDRYTPSIYKDLLIYIQDGTQMEPCWNPNGTQMEPQVRLGKDRLGKVRLDKASTGEERVGEDRGCRGEGEPAPAPIVENSASDQKLQKLQTEPTMEDETEVDNSRQPMTIERDPQTKTAYVIVDGRQVRKATQQEEQIDFAFQKQQKINMLTG